MTDGEFSKRPPIPRGLRREVEVEAGHRCAIPTCRQTSGLEIHHIVPWAKVREHTFENLILLCAVCHARATKGEIDQTAMKQHKLNLGLMTQRYGDFERRILEWFLDAGNLDRALVLDYSNILDVHLRYLLGDGLLVATTLPAGGGFTFTDAFGSRPLSERRAYTLTPAGKALVENIAAARSLS